METTKTGLNVEMTRGRNKLAATVVLGHAIKHVYLSGLQVILLPELKMNMMFTATQYGILSSSRQATSWFTTVGAGYLGDRFANRSALMLAISMLLMGSSYFLAGTAQNYWFMLMAMLFVGVGPSLYHPPAIGALSRRFPDKRGLAISLHGTGGSIGEVIGPVATAVLLTVMMWREVLQASLFPAVLSGFALWAMMRSVPGDVPGSSSSSEYFAALANLLKKRAIIVLVLITAMRSVGMAAIMTFLPVYLREDLAYSPYGAASLMSLAQLVGIGTQPAMGHLSDTHGRKRILVPAMLILGLSILALLIVEPGWKLITTVSVMGAFMYSLHTIFIAAAMDVAEGEVQSTVVSLIYGASFLGTVSPIFAGLIVDNFGMQAAFLYAGVAVILATIVLASLRLPQTTSN